MSRLTHDVVHLDWSVFQLHSLQPPAKYRHSALNRDQGIAELLSVGLNPYHRPDVYWFMQGAHDLYQSLEGLSREYRRADPHKEAIAATEFLLSEFLECLVPFVPKAAFLRGEVTVCSSVDLRVPDSSLWVQLLAAFIHSVRYFVYPQSSYAKKRAGERRDWVRSELGRRTPETEGAVCRRLLGAQSLMIYIVDRCGIGEETQGQLEMALAQLGGDLIEYAPTWVRQRAEAQE